MLAALLPALLYRYARARGFAPLWSATIALTIALGTQVLPYSTILMVHAPSAALLLYAMMSERRLLGGFAAGMAATMNYLCLPAAIVLAIAGRRPGRFLVGLIPPLAGLLIYQNACFGGLFSTGI